MTTIAGSVTFAPAEAPLMITMGTEVRAEFVRSVLEKIEIRNVFVRSRE